MFPPPVYPRWYPSPGRPWWIGLALVVALSPGIPGARAQERLPPDPVEAFREALQQDKDLRNSQIEALTFREQALTKAARKITTLADLSRALLLYEWPLRSEDIRLARDEAAVRDIEHKIRTQLTERFARGVQDVLARGDATRLAAVCSLVAETIAGASALGDERLSLFEGLDDLAPGLVRLTRNHSPLVEQAAATALADFPTRAQANVIPALLAMLEDRSGVDEQTRVVAADALGDLVRTAAGRDPPEVPSEPGVRSSRFRRPRGRIPLTRAKPYLVATLAVPVAVKGLGDPSPAVRLASAEALWEITRTVKDTIPQVDLVNPALTGLDGAPYPPYERWKNWTEEEQESVWLGNQHVQRLNKDLTPILDAFDKAREPLVAGILDRDPRVRLQVRRVVENLAISRRLLEQIYDFVPPLPPGFKPPKEFGAVGLGPPSPRRVAQPTLGSKAGQSWAGVVALGVPRKSPSPSAGKTQGSPRGPHAGRTTPWRAVRQAASPSSALRRVAFQQPVPMPGANPQQGPENKERTQGSEKASEELLRVIQQARARIVAEALEDPNYRSRLAAIEILENMQLEAAPAIPSLIRALRDPNRFVRWAAARTLGRLAERADLIAKGDSGYRKQEKITDVIEKFLAQLPDAVPYLTPLLYEHELGLRLATASALGRFGPRAKEAVPTLRLAVLSRSDAEFRIEVMRALEGIGLASESALPALARSLRDPDPRVRTEAARVLGRFGRRSMFALPDLRQTLTDRDPEVRRVASEAILNITTTPGI